MKRIATRLKKDSLITMASWPKEKCSELPERIQATVMYDDKRIVLVLKRSSSLAVAQLELSGVSHTVISDTSPAASQLIDFD
ncbi:hypothetical protein KIN20_029551 [Parelaphostrongylus tenuis]|uniref:Uncharacterized protein n=1 Tax=Parelaphostrongylus tenuis TaxID=148309 RepID=A0AAD5R2T3_PARTN|nr:hypothetical protein KIN20_029551 [Parelaphostrongylus tenuis]